MTQRKRTGVLHYAVPMGPGQSTGDSAVRKTVPPSDAEAERRAKIRAAGRRVIARHHELLVELARR